MIWIHHDYFAQGLGMSLLYVLPFIWYVSTDAGYCIGCVLHFCVKLPVATRPVECKCYAQLDSYSYIAYP